jgi:hemolysin activation/secretion protein
MIQTGEIGRSGRIRTATFAAAILAMAVGMTGTAQAQTLPSTAEPGAVTQPFTQEVPQPRAEPGGEVEVPEPQFGPEAEGVQFLVQDIVLEGSTVYSEADLAGLIGPIEGREASLAEIDALAQQLTARYRADGFILSQVIIPEQEIEDGTVRLVALEGFIEDVTFDGDIRGPQSILDAHAERVMADRPLRAETLERALLLIGDLAGVRVRSVLSAAPATPGASVLQVELEHTPFEAFASVDNYGSESTGRETLSGGLSFFSALGQYEQIDLFGAMALEDADLFFGEARVTTPIGTAGDYLRLAAAASRSTPAITFEPESFTQEFRVTYFTPIIRSREQNLTARFGFTWRDEETDTDFFATPTQLIDDSLRIVRIGAQADFVDDALGVNLFDVEVRQGLGIFGASNEGDPNLSRGSGEAEFTSVRFIASRTQSLGGGWQLYGEVRGQVASDPLLASEEFSVGGPAFGRGYDPGTITGDNGFAARAELRFGQFFDEGDVLTSYQVYGFVDHGFVGNIDADTSPVGDITSAGAGVRFNITENISGNVELAHRFRDVPGQSDDTRVLFSLNVRLP